MYNRYIRTDDGTYTKVAEEETPHGQARQEPDKDATCDNLPNTFVLPFPTLAERLMGGPKSLQESMKLVSLRWKFTFSAPVCS